MQERNDETEGRQGTWGAGIQGTPAIFLIIHLFLTPNVQEGGFSPRVAYRRKERKTDATRGGKPLPIVVSFHTGATRGGELLPVVFPSTKT